MGHNNLLFTENIKKKEKKRIKIQKPLINAPLIYNKKKKKN